MPDRVQLLIDLALQEDIGTGDITTEALIPDDRAQTGIVTAKQDLVVSGLEIARRVFDTVDRRIVWERMVDDGALVGKGAPLAKVRGPFKSLLRAERTALNFLQHLSGVATLTRRFVLKVKHYPVQILDTRKTTPGMRAFEKHAVRMGGGKNHRLGLFDRFLIKDNHLASVGVTEAVSRARAQNVNKVPIEIEVGAYGNTPLQNQIEEAVQAGADILLLDNLSPKELKKAVEKVAGRAKTEASGGITLENVVTYAKTGVDSLSIGALTHSAPAADISLEIGGDPSRPRS